MNVKSVVKLIEVRTLVAGFFPVLLGSIYSLYTYHRINLIFLISLILAMGLVQSATNMLNDFMDFYRGTDDSDKKEEKVFVSGEVKPNQILVLLILFPLIALLIGIWIASQTSYYILLVATVGAFIAIFYSFGPCPISHTPFGEVASGITMGIGITATSGYIQSGRFGIDFIAYIMFTNNLCDRDADLQANRHTLPGMIGFQAAKWIWIFACMILCFITLVLIWIGIFPVSTLLCMGILWNYKEIYPMKSFEQKDFSKKVMMKIIGKIGIQYHVLLILAFFTAWVFEVFK